ncbi:MFS transporter [Salinarimonas soli]|uniref:MFS transporter n=1 Tax=Salinarimonas soli TaxID=1638099 RepID=A0A5B2VSE5_9HYPH|nr:MFS transporter [Salinarimonas soli]KAA2242141.1 MFS transporter [Salinarimonas soli]
MGSGYILLLAAYVVSIVGDWSFKIAIPVIVMELTGSPLLMSVAFACSFAPYIVMMPLGGVVADLFRRQRILYLGDFAAAALCTLICAYLALGGTNVYVLFPALFGLGIVSSVYHPAFQSFIPNVVAREALPRANATFATSDNLLNLLGPAISGGLVAAFRPDWIIWFNAASFLVSGLAILAIRAQVPEVARQVRVSVAGIGRDLADGFRIAWSEPIIKWGTILFIGENFATNAILGNEIYFLTEVLGLSVSQAGLVIGASAAGAVAGSLVAPALMARFAPGRLMLSCLFVIAGGTAVMLLAQNLGIAAVVLGRGLLMGARAVIIVTMFTYRQRVIPQAYLGRTVAITRTISYVPVPVSAVVGGYVLAQTGGNMQAVLLMSVGTLLACALLGLLTPFARAQQPGDLPSAPLEESHAR